MEILIHARGNMNTLSRRKREGLRTTEVWPMSCKHHGGLTKGSGLGGGASPPRGPLTRRQGPIKNDA